MVAAVVLITLGVLFLLNNLVPGYGFGRTWPVILIVVGLVKVGEFIRSYIGAGHRSAETEPEPPEGKERP